MSQKKNYFQKIVDLFVEHDYPPFVRNDFFQWLANEEHSTQKDEALRGLWKKTATGEVDRKIPRSSLKRMRRNIGLQPAKRGIRIIRLWQGVAAILLLLLASSLYLSSVNRQSENDLIQQYVPVAEMSTFILPDGSEVQLNSQSTLLYPQSFSGKNRCVYLIGEGNFKVKPNKKQPFIVKSSDFQVTALGTEFNISAYPENTFLEATLISGSVRVEFNNLQCSKLLQPNEQLAYNKQTQTPLLLYPDMKDVTAWQRGELVFREMTLKDIITILERKYPYHFKYSLNDLKDDKYCFRFKDKAPLPQVMDIIVSVVGHMNYKIEGSTCFVRTK